MNTMRAALLLAAVLFTATAEARRGDEVNNGGGLAEYNILYAFDRLDSYIDMCLASPACRLNGEERGILLRIRESLPAEWSASPVKFESERSRPGFFVLDGELKIAKTGSQVGSPIYFNVDLLYRRNMEGRFESITVAEAVAFLVHELGHHAGERDHVKLDLLGLKVSQSVQALVYATPLSPTSREVNLTVINGPGATSKPTVLLYVFGAVYDLSAIVWSAITCPSVVVPLPVLPHIQLGNKKPNGVILHNVHWARQGKPGTSFQVEADVTKFCKDQVTLQEADKSYKIVVKFEIEPAGGAAGSWKLKSNSVGVRHLHDPWWWVF